MARNTVRDRAEAAANEIGLKDETERKWFIKGFVAGQSDALAEVAKRKL